MSADTITLTLSVKDVFELLRLLPRTAKKRLRIYDRLEKFLIGPDVAVLQAMGENCER